MAERKSRSRLKETCAVGAVLVVALGWWMGGDWGLGSGSGSQTGEGNGESAGERMYRFDLVEDRVEFQGQAISTEELGRMAERARSEGATLVFQVKEGVRGLFVEEIQKIVSRARVRVLGLD